MNNIQNKNIDELLQKENTIKLEYEAFKEIKLTKKNYLTYIIVIILSAIFAYVLSFRVDTQEIFCIAVDKFMNLDIAFIAVIFGAYALFQAMISDDFLSILSNVNGQLKNSNKSFLNLILLYVYAIIINFFILLGISCLEDNFILLSNIKLDNFLCWFFICIYFIYNTLVIVEVKNFAINLYRMFNAYNAYKITINAANNKE